MSDLRSYWLIRRSDLFDRDYYAQNCPEVRESASNPILHYIRTGWREGRNPSGDFDTLFYLRENRDVRQAKVNPLAHYLRADKAEGRLPTLAHDHNQKSYAGWIRRYDTLTVTDRRLISTHQKSFLFKPLISILMVVEDPGEAYFRRAIESVLAQLYPNWELCIGLLGLTGQPIKNILKAYTSRDNRIKHISIEPDAPTSSALNTLLESESGEYFGLMGGEDLLHEHALYLTVCEVNNYPNAAIIYTDEDRVDETGERYQPYFKPHWSPDLFYTHNLIGHLGLYSFRPAILAGGFRCSFEGAEAWDLALRMIEKISLTDIRHIPHVLYHLRAPILEVADFNEFEEQVVMTEHKALRSHFNSRQIHVALSHKKNGYWQVKRLLPAHLPLVSLIIPSKNQVRLLQNCLESIQTKSTYPNYEIIVINNQSDQPKALEYLNSISNSGNISVLNYDYPFNYSAINNFASRHSNGEVLVFLNNDTEVISPGWLEELVSHAIRPEIGAVGGFLLYPDGTIQHAGIVLGTKHVGNLVFYRSLWDLIKRDYNQVFLPRNYSALTAACMAIKKDLFLELGGFNEKNLPVSHNDIDLCLRLLKKGYLNLWSPYAKLYHHESTSRGYEDSLEKQSRHQMECDYIRKTYPEILSNDPGYNPNLSLDYIDYGLSHPPRAEKPWLAIKHE